MPMTGFSRPLYSIGAVAEMLGVPAATLRTWQERYGVVQPERSPAGHRLYSRDQLEQLRFLADQIAAGLSPGTRTDCCASSWPAAAWWVPPAMTVTPR